MLYDRYLESTRGDDFRVEDELNRAKLLFRAFYAPRIPAGSAARILDIGCGFGKVLWAARDCGFPNIEGVDLSQDQIEFGRSLLGLPLQKGDAAERLAALKGELDAILAIDVLEHFDLEYSVNLLRSARTALKSGGVLIAQVPNGLSPFAPTFHGDVTHVRAYSPISLAQLFRFAGFKAFQFHAMPPVVHGAASGMRRALWSAVLQPLIRAYFLVACGTSMGGIYTPNFIGIAANEG